MTDLRDRIADTLQRHWENASPCTCRECALQHADAVIKDLDLTETFGVIIGCNHEDHHE